MSSHKAYKMSRELVWDTCPTVELILDEAQERIRKEVTDNFRDALVGVLDELLQAQERIAELEGQVEELQEKVEAYELQYELNH